MNAPYMLTLDKWTLTNWKSEYKRLQVAYRKSEDKSSLEARGISDQLKAIEEIVKERYLETL